MYDDGEKVDVDDMLQELKEELLDKTGCLGDGGWGRERVEESSASKMAKA